MTPPTVLDVYEARRRLRPHLSPTPLLPSAWLSSVSGGSVFLKLEAVNLTRSFKIRGALNAVLKLAAQARDPAPRIVTASAGNHGRALALAAERVGLACDVFTPAGAPDAKKEAIRGHGAVLHDDCPDYDTAEERAREFAASTGAVYLSPYNHPDVIAGAGTIGLEIVEALPALDVIVIPLGGGGLASGVGLALRAAAPRATIIGVEVDASSPFTAGLAAGRIVSIVPRESLADGLTGNLEPGSITFPLVQRVVDRIVTVREPAVADAMAALGAHERLIAEGAGATAAAAVLAGGVMVPNQRTVVLVTGSNVDLATWLSTVR